VTGAFRLDGKWVLMTGALGILGIPCTEALARAGARLVIVDLDPDACAARAAELTKSGCAEAIGIGADIGDEGSVAALGREIERCDVAIDVLINAAATKSPDFFAPLERYPLGDWTQVMRVNVTGIFLMLRAFLPGMAARRRGSVVNFGSIYGILGPDPRIYEGSHYAAMGSDRNPTGSINTPLVYSASKGAVSAISRHIATMYGPMGIRANTLIPGGVQSGQNETFVARYSSQVPLGRMGMPADIANALVFLASDASAYVTGQELVVDGGRAIW
jgi:NAD(P)-dependent dehydrogenase (short-subunit alcohol dehydrogenase family)